MIKIEVKENRTKGKAEVRLEMQGNSNDVLAEAGQIVRALVEQIIEVGYSNSIMLGFGQNNVFTERQVQRVAKMMQLGFSEGIEGLKKKGILSADYGKDIAL
ncbi:hypothetical protein [Eubacterium limosum]|uniref:hypothetical protein n=1 Tax=Eubacterium limosum TaxID=1736 RepID=UPI001063BCF4|nr:hypothetical protein [Eubacterium limosum]